MSKDEFLHALKDDLPQDFSASLRDQLKQIDAETSLQAPEVDRTSRPSSNRGYILAAAVLATAIIGLMLFFANTTSDDMAMNILQPAITLDQHGEINSATVADLQPITRFGNGFARDIGISQDGSELVVVASNGFYFHDANDFTATPRFIPFDGFFNLIEQDDAGNLYGTVDDFDAQTSSVVRVDSTTGQIATLLTFGARFTFDIAIAPQTQRVVVMLCKPLESDQEDAPCQNDDDALQVYDLETGQLGASLPISAHHSIFDISDDGRDLVYGAVDENNDYTLYYMDLLSGATQPILRRTYATALNWVLISPDGNDILTHANQRVAQWTLADLLNRDEPVDHENDEADALQIRTLFGETNIEQPLLHPDGETLLGLGAMSLFQYNLNTQDKDFVSTALQLNDFHIGFKFHPDGNHVYGISYSGAIRRFSYPDGTLQETLYDYDGGYDHALYFRSDTEFFSTVTRASSTHIRQWQIEGNTITGDLFRATGDQPTIVTKNIAISPNGRYLFYDSRFTPYQEDEGYLWLHDLDTDTRYSMRRFETSSSVDFLDDETLLGLGYSLGYTYDYRARINAELESLAMAQSFTYSDDLLLPVWWSTSGQSMAISPDGKTMVSLPCFAYAVQSTSQHQCEGQIVVWDLTLRQPLYRIQDDSWRTGIGLAIAPDNTTVIVNACNRPEETQAIFCEDTYIYDLSNIEAPPPSDLVPTFEVEAVNHIHFEDQRLLEIKVHPQTSDETLLAISSYEKTFFTRLNDDFTLDQLATLPFGGGVTFSPSGDLIFTTSDNGQLEVWGVPPTASQ